jgi:predicted dehydrogenase/MFS family permease
MIPKRYLLILGTFLLSMLLYVDRACISAAKEAICAPVDEGGLALSETQMGWVMAAFTLGYALCQTPAGLLADRFGPRRVLTAVVTFWSLFTALTGAVWDYVSMLAARSLFGAGEAGAFPGCARAFFSWLPLSERGLAQGINFSGSRLGAALAFPVIGWMVDSLGWRPSFVILGGIGVLWAVFWYAWFRDEPADHPGISHSERERILRERQQAGDRDADAPGVSPATLFRSRNMWLAMGQYVCSNFTFYFALGWSLPYLKQEFGLTSLLAGVYAAWRRIPEVEITATCNRDAQRARTVMDRYGIRKHYADYREMLEAEGPDFVDVITPPGTHVEMCRFAAERGVHVICQKPLAPTFDDARQIVADARHHGIRLMVHENFRFQPWHREIKRLMLDGAIGGKLHSLYFRMRQGDGWGDDAYLDRQPYFRTMPRLLVYETGVHFIDTFRYLGGEIDGVYGVLRRLNPVIAGEDTGVIVFEFRSGAVGLWDANRYNECNDSDPRFTFGEFLVEGSGGSIRLYLDGRLTIHPLGKEETEHEYPHERLGFAGDCVYATQRHFVDCMLEDRPFETDGEDYLKTLAVQEAVYRSAETRQAVRGIASEDGL